MTPLSKLDFIINGAEVRFTSGPDGTILMHDPTGERPIGSVAPAFPFTCPKGMIGLRDREGNEIGILEGLAGLDAQSRRLVEEALERCYFMPRIHNILDIQEVLSVVEWEVETNKGARAFQVRDVRKSIRRVAVRKLVIKDVDGNRYQIPDWMTLPAHAQKLLEPYI